MHCNAVVRDFVEDSVAESTIQINLIDQISWLVRDLVSFQKTHASRAEIIKF
jgi:hypothetical protein